MDRVRQIYATIIRQLGTLSPSQKLLIGSLCVIVLMTLFLVSQYAGSPKYVELIPTGTAEDQQNAHNNLLSVGFPVTMQNGKVVVPAERQYPALAQLSRAQMLPTDKELYFRDLVERQNMFMPKGQIDQMYTTALTNELSKLIKNFDGISDAKVFISAPERTGLGQAAKKPTATVTVFTTSGGRLEQRTVNAFADLVSGAVSGLDVKNVSIIDGATRRSYRAASPEDVGAMTYIEQVAAVEDRVRTKIEDHLGKFIAGVVVSVNAMVDAADRSIEKKEVLPKNEGTVVVPIKIDTTESGSTNTSKSSEPGLAGNVGADINSGGGSVGSSTKTETKNEQSAVEFGSAVTMQRDAKGRPTKINVTVSVPREYVLQILKDKTPTDPNAGGDGAGGAAPGPSAEDIDKEWLAQQPKLVEMIKPLIDTKDVPNTVAQAGDVVVALMPVAMAGVFVPGGGGGVGSVASGTGFGSGGGGGIGKMLSSGLIKQVALGALAVVALGMMFLLVKKAGKTSALPSAEELVGIPPALQPDSDLVGEADESDTAMIGIEVDSDALKTSKMLEEVEELVKKNPQSAATVFSRWIAPEG